MCFLILLACFLNAFINPLLTREEDSTHPLSLSALPHFAADSLDVVIIQSATSIVRGQELTIDFFAGCKSIGSIRTVKFGEEIIKPNPQGTISYVITGEEVGAYHLPITVSYSDKNGRLKRAGYFVDWTVNELTFSISLDRMNTLYIGVDNPVTVATSLGGDDVVSVSISGGASLTKYGAGRFVAHVSSPTDNCIITLSVGERVIGAAQFRVRPLPVPTAHIAGYTSCDSISAKVFIAQQGIGASLNGFGFDIHYTITGYTLNVEDDAGKIQLVNNDGAVFTSQTKAFIQQYIKPGKIVTIGNLFAKSPSGESLKLMPLIYTLR